MSTTSIKPPNIDNKQTSSEPGCLGVILLLIVSCGLAGYLIQL